MIEASAEHAQTLLAEASETASIRPLRVLHVVGHLTRGGIETWLYQVLRRTDKRDIDADVLVLTSANEPMTQAFKDAGIEIRVCPPVRRPDRFLAQYLSLLSKYKYDIVHVHGFSMLAMLSLFAAWLRRVPVRIWHGHNDLRPRLANASAMYRAYVAVSLRLSRFLCNRRAACSLKAAEWTFGENWTSLRPPVELLIGIDMEPCFAEADPTLRAQLGLPEGRHVLAQVGRCTMPKNHKFTVRVAEVLHQRNVPIHLLFLGDGPLREETQKQLVEAGLEQHYTWIRDCDRVPAVFKSVVDIALLPSFNEGLGLVVIEAQAAGVLTLVSNHVTTECAVVTELVDFLPIDQGPAIWAQKVMEHLQTPLTSQAAQQHQRLIASRFNIDVNAERLSQIYRTAIGRQTV